MKSSVILKDFKMLEITSLSSILTFDCFCNMLSNPSRNFPLLISGHCTCNSSTFLDMHLKDILKNVKLLYLLEREGGLNAILNWEDVLSLGEQQRIGMVSSTSCNKAQNLSSVRNINSLKSWLICHIFVC